MLRFDIVPFMPDMFSLRYLIHGTNEKNLDSIRRLGLLPGGTRGGRNHVHFALDSTLSTMKDVLRSESDCILIARPGAVAGLGPVITHNRYVLTDQTVPFTPGSVVFGPSLTVPGLIHRNRLSCTE